MTKPAELADELEAESIHFYGERPVNASREKLDKIVPRELFDRAIAALRARAPAGWRLDVRDDAEKVMRSLAEAFPRQEIDLDACRRLAVAVLSSPAAPQGDGWLPIESAPKDGTRILVTWSGGDNWDAELVSWELSFGWMDAGGNVYAHSETPTHWKPLELPPAPDAAQEGK